MSNSSFVDCIKFIFVWKIKEKTLKEQTIKFFFTVNLHFNRITLQEIDTAFIFNCITQINRIECDKQYEIMITKTKPLTVQWH